MIESSKERDDGKLPLFQTVAIVGVGLLGGSVGLAMKTRGVAARVLGIDRRADVLQNALSLGAIDLAVDNLEGAKEADLIVLGTPVGVIPELLGELKSIVKPNAILTDLGSVKSRIVEAGERIFGDRFLGGHPMAGSEESGILAARADLFEGAAWVFCRTDPTDFEKDIVAGKLSKFAEALGAKPVCKPAGLHDHLVALISHLPHVISYAYSEMIDLDESAIEAKEIAAGSYRDLTRTAKSDRTLWNGIFLENRTELLIAITEMQLRLEELKRTLEV